MLNQSQEESVARALITALLLTGDSAAAESAVMQSIEALSISEFKGEALAILTAETVLLNRRVNAEMDPNAAKRACAMLKPELRELLGLSRRCRDSFVLRFLLGLPKHVCAELLRAEPDELDQWLCAAVWQLPHIGRQPSLDDCKAAIPIPA